MLLHVLFHDLLNQHLHEHYDNLDWKHFDRYAGHLKPDVF